MIPETHQVREDFDRIALLTEQEGGSERALYYSYFLRHLPQHCESALEVGCGAGAFTRLLAARARRVVACDLSPQMIRRAQKMQQQQPASGSHIEYLTGDVMRLSFAAESFDCIVTIATLHHLPLVEALLKMKNALKPGGRLVIHDMVADDGLIDRAVSAFAYPVNAAMRFCTTGRLLPSKKLRAAWNEHGKHETYLTLSEVKEMCRQHLPGASARRHLFWRYTVVWSKATRAV